MRAPATAIAFFVVCLFAATSCGGAKDAEVPRPSERESAPRSCSGLIGKWREVEPTDDTTIEEPNEDKVRAVPSGSTLLFEPARLTIVSKTDRSESSIVVERVATGTCLLHGRDSQGRPIDIEASLVGERLLRMHNVAEPRSPTSLYERQ